MKNIRVWFVTIIGLIAMSGSLYFSLVRHFPVCDLCWYQRICMYPIGVLSLIGGLKKDSKWWHYIILLSTVGLLFSSYHVFLEIQNDLQSKSIYCPFGATCLVKYINWFGFITIPKLSFTAFLLINGLIGWEWLAKRTK